MRNSRRVGWLFLAATAALMPATVAAQQNDDENDAPPARRVRRAPVTAQDEDAIEAPAPRATRRSAPSEVLGSHQIDRFEAIRQLRQALKADAQNEGDWIILGELAHEAALDLPSDQDDAYYRLSREAFANALRLDPDNVGLKAAVQLARDQESNVAQFDRARQRAARTYLEARRREVAASGFSPTIQVDGSAAPSAAEGDDADADPAAAPPRRRQSRRVASGPVYQPYSPRQGSPVTYQKYSDTYAPATQDSPTRTPPTTLRGFAEQLPEVLFNEVKGGARGGIPVPPPR